MSQVIQGNCLDVLKTLEDNSIDLTVTSPPYDNLREYKGYTFDFEGIAKELFRVTKQGGVVVWVVGDATINGSETCTSDRQKLYFKDVCGFNVHDTMIYFKICVPPMYPGCKRYTQKFEYMFVFSKGRLNTFNPIKDKPNKHAGENKNYIGMRQRDGSVRKKIYQGNVVRDFSLRDNVWSFPTGGKKMGDHPAIFPDKLAEDHILSWSNEGDTVLDPFAGSGTTLKMAKMNNRNYIGIEISHEYIDIINKRLAQDYLFTNPPAEEI